MNDIQKREAKIDELNKAIGASDTPAAYKVRIYTRDWDRSNWHLMYSYPSLTEFLSDFREDACAGDCDPEYVEVIAVEKHRVIWHNQYRCNKSIAEVVA